MENGTAPSAKELFYKTQVCKFYAAGKCDRGRRCTYAHGEERKANLPDFYRTRLCPSYMRKGTCANGSACTYAHSKGELRGGVTKETSNAANASDLAFGSTRQPKPPGFVLNEMHTQLQAQLLANLGRHQESIANDFNAHEGSGLSSESQRVPTDSRMFSEYYEQPNDGSSAAGHPSDFHQILNSMAEQVPPPPERLLQRSTNTKSGTNRSASKFSEPHINASPSFREAPIPVRQSQTQRPMPVVPEYQAAQQLNTANLNLEQLEVLANIGARHLAGLGVDFQSILGNQQVTQPPQRRFSDGMKPPHESVREDATHEFGPQIGALLELRRQLLLDQESQGQRQLLTPNAPTTSSAIGRNALDSNTQPRQRHRRYPSNSDTLQTHSEPLRRNSATSNSDGFAASARFPESREPAGVDSLVQSLQAVFQREDLRDLAKERSSFSPLQNTGWTNFGTRVAPEVEKHPTTQSPHVYQPVDRFVSKPPKHAEAMRAEEALKSTGNRQMGSELGVAHRASADTLVAQDQQEAKYGMVVKNSFLEMGNEDSQAAANRFKSQTLPNLPPVDFDQFDDTEESLETVSYSHAGPAGMQSLIGQHVDLSSSNREQTLPGNGSRETALSSANEAPSTVLSSSSSQSSASAIDHMRGSRIAAFKSRHVSKIEGPPGLTVKNTFLDVDDIALSEIDFRNASATAPELPLLFLDGEDEPI